MSTPTAPAKPPPSIDLMLYHAGAPNPQLSAWLEPPAALLQGGARCFRRVFVRHANLSATAQHYLGGWDNTGPNNLFYGLFFDAAIHRAYDMLLWMETDMVPVAPHWLRRVSEEVRHPRGFWRKGPAQQPRGWRTSSCLLYTSPSPRDS